MVWRSVSLANLKCGWKGTGTRSAVSSGEEQRGSRGKTRNKPPFTSYHPWAFCASLLSSLKEAFVTDAQILYDLFQRERRSFYLFPSSPPPSPFSRFGGNKHSPVLRPPPHSPPGGRGAEGEHTHTHGHGRPPDTQGLSPGPAQPVPSAAPGPPRAAGRGRRQSVRVCVCVGGDGHPQQRGRLPSPAAPAPPHHRSGAQRKRTRRSIHPPHLKPSRFPRAVAAGSGPSVT